MVAHPSGISCSNTHPKPSRLASQTTRVSRPLTKWRFSVMLCHGFKNVFKCFFVHVVPCEMEFVFD